MIEYVTLARATPIGAAMEPCRPSRTHRMTNPFFDRPMLKAKKQGASKKRAGLQFSDASGPGSADQSYAHTTITVERWGQFCNDRLRPTAGPIRPHSAAGI